ncbi:GyrI-like domain-containing protein [Paenibacillus aurantiacus]|uniref:GyrI-like domain-containing protein n=1 Tax=Paenibacillus aurantiacus TaxID=1936118 RepID=A0ABV5KUD3_9BACL
MMNKPMKPMTEGYKPTSLPLALKVIAGGLRHKEQFPSYGTVMEGERTMTAHLDHQKPNLIHNVRDVRQAAEWYRDNLGFEIGPHEFGSFAEMLLGGQYMFHLTPARGAVTPHPSPVFSFASLDIEMTHRMLQERGVAVDPIRWFPDYSSFAFRDLDGNAVLVSQSFEIRMRDVESIHLVGYRLTLPEVADRIALIQEAAQALRARAGEIAGALDPFFMIGAHLPGQADYWVGLQVSTSANIPAGMEAVTLPGRRYAVKWHYGLRSGVQATYQRMHELLEQAGMTPDPQAWRIEMTRNWGSKAEDEELEMDLYLAVET